MKKTMKKFAERLTAALNRLGEDYDMLQVDESMAFYTQMRGCEPYDDDLFI